MIARYFFLAFIAAAALAVWPITAAAHASLTKAEPPEDAVLPTPPDTVKLWFSGRIEAEFSRIEVTDADGTRVDKDNTTGGDDRRTLEVGLNDLEAGEYQVTWNIVARDGHRMTGDYTFVVE